MPSVFDLLRQEVIDVLRQEVKDANPDGKELLNGWIGELEELNRGDEGNMLCEICEHQEKTGGKYCDDCRDDFKTSEDDK